MGSQSIIQIILYKRHNMTKETAHDV